MSKTAEQQYVPVWEGAGDQLDLESMGEGLEQVAWAGSGLESHGSRVAFSMAEQELPPAGEIPEEMII